MADEKRVKELNAEVAKLNREEAQKAAKLEKERTQLSPAQVEAGKMKEPERKAHAEKAAKDGPLEPTLQDFRTSEPVNPDESTPREFHRDSDRRPGDPTPQERDALAKKEGKPVADRPNSGGMVGSRQPNP